jgi:hypothetical protein
MYENILVTIEESVTITGDTIDSTIDKPGETNPIVSKNMRMNYFEEFLSGSLDFALFFWLACN